MQRSTKIALGLLVLLAFVVGTTANGQGRWASTAEGKTETRATNTHSRQVVRPSPSLASPSATRTWRSLNQQKQLRSKASAGVVPNFRGQQLQQSQNVLAKAGWYRFSQHDATGAGRVQVLDTNWIVCRTQPRAGRKVSLQAEIHFYAVKRDERCPR